MAVMKMNDFDVCCKTGTKWEKTIVELFSSNKINMKSIIQHTPYEKFPDLNKKGIDAKMEVDFQVKVRTNDYEWTYCNEILFEFVKGSNEGCHKKLLEIARNSDYVIVPIFLYCWLDNEEGSKIKKWGIWVAYTKEFCNWIEGEGKKYFKDINPAYSSRVGGNLWETNNKVMKVKDGEKFFNKFSTKVFQLKLENQTLVGDWT